VHCQVGEKIAKLIVTLKLNWTWNENIKYLPTKRKTTPAQLQQNDHERTNHNY